MRHLDQTHRRGRGADRSGGGAAHYRRSSVRDVSAIGRNGSRSNAAHSLAGRPIVIDIVAARCYPTGVSPARGYALNAAKCGASLGSTPPRSRDTLRSNMRATPRTPAGSRIPSANRDVRRCTCQRSLRSRILRVAYTLSRRHDRIAWRSPITRMIRSHRSLPEI